MQKNRFPSYMAYGIASFVCPILAVTAVLAYQSIAYSSFWQSLTPEDNAGALTVIGEAIEFAAVTLAGCFLGLLCAAASVRLQKRIWGVGLAGLVFNGLPFLFLILLWIKWSVVGV